MTPQRLQEVLDTAASKRLLVIGDLMLDEFVWGKVGRISPEAPVPVVEVTSESSYPGGAANVARNLRDFVGGASVVGLIGTDRGGRQLRRLLDEGGSRRRKCCRTRRFPTIVKTRIIARQQQVVRVDREEIRAPDEEQVARVVESVRAELPRVDGVIFEDYGKGFLGAGAGAAGLANSPSRPARSLPPTRIRITRSRGKASPPSNRIATRHSSLPVFRAGRSTRSA